MAGQCPPNLREVRGGQGRCQAEPPETAAALVLRLRAPRGEGGRPRWDGASHAHQGALASGPRETRGSVSPFACSRHRARSHRAWEGSSSPPCSPSGQDAGFTGRHPPHGCLPRPVPAPWPLLRALTSDVVISSISAKVGALSRTRGRGRGATLPASVVDRLMQEVDLTSPEQALRMQGREPNSGGGKAVRGRRGLRGAGGGGRHSLTPAAPALGPHWAQPPLLLDLLQDLLVQGPLLLGYRAESPLGDLQGCGSAVGEARPGPQQRGGVLSEATRTWGSPAASPAEPPACPLGGSGKGEAWSSTCFRGGRERMKSRMSSWASFFTLGGISPSTCGEGGEAEPETPWPSAGATGPLGLAVTPASLSEAARCGSGVWHHQQLPCPQMLHVDMGPMAPTSRSSQEQNELAHRRF